MFGNNVTRKYWLIADRPNEAKIMWPFFTPCSDFMGGGGMATSAPLFLHPRTCQLNKQKLIIRTDRIFFKFLGMYSVYR